MRRLAIKPATVLLLVRHGESVCNVSGTLGGQVDSPLTERGGEQAKHVAAYLEAREEAELVLTSDLLRASTTANIIADRLGLRIVEEPGLREMDLGKLSQVSLKDLKSKMPGYLKALKSPADGFKPFGGESLPEFEGRVCQALERMSQRFGGQRWIVVTHGGVINWMLQGIIGGQQNPLLAQSFFAVRNASTSKLRVLEGLDGKPMWRIEYVGAS